MERFFSIGIAMDNLADIAILVVIMALAFDFINGFHDAANSIATIVTTKILTPVQAVTMAAICNFLAFAVFSLHVANTIGIGLVSPGILSPTLLLTALLAAITWNLITWYFGLPSSSSHALIGGLIGAAIGKAGISVLNADGLLSVLAGMLISPVLGFFFGFLISQFYMGLHKIIAPQYRKSFFAGMQICSSAALSLTHGGNDAQKTMGLIAVVLFSEGYLGPTFYIPNWVVFACYFTIALGTLAGGWRIVKTMGQDITKLHPQTGSAAESSAAMVIFAATELGVPISTTHTVTGSIAGVGSHANPGKTRWQVLGKIGIAWALTVPMTMLLAALATQLLA